MNRPSGGLSPCPCTRPTATQPTASDSVAPTRPQLTPPDGTTATKHGGAVGPPPEELESERVRERASAACLPALAPGVDHAHDPSLPLAHPLPRHLPPPPAPSSATQRPPPARHSEAPAALASRARSAPGAPCGDAMTWAGPPSLNTAPPPRPLSPLVVPEATR